MRAASNNAVTIQDWDCVTMFNHILSFCDEIYNLVYLSSFSQHATALHTGKQFRRIDLSTPTVIPGQFGKLGEISDRTIPTVCRLANLL